MWTVFFAKDKYYYQSNLNDKLKEVEKHEIKKPKEPKKVYPSLDIKYKPIMKEKWTYFGLHHIGKK